MGNDYKILVGNIINHNNSFFGSVKFDNSKIVEVKVFDNDIRIDSEYILPGFIDTNNGGGYGFDFSSTTYDDTLTASYVVNTYKEGVTSVCASTGVDTIEELCSIGKNIESLVDYILIGWHIKGLYIASNQRGIYSTRYINNLNRYTNEIKLNDLDKIVMTNDLIKIFTFAPEEKNSINFFKKFNGNKKVILSIGNSNATAEQALDALKNGVTRYTNLFNYMTKFDHIKPGIPNVAMGYQYGYVEIIPNGYYISNMALSNLFNIIGPNRLIISSDSIISKGLENNDYLIKNHTITKKSKISFIKNTHIVAGNNVKYINLVKNFAAVTNCTFNDIVKVTSWNPAASLNLQNEYGKIEFGYKSDFVVLDNQLTILQTYKNGKLVYKKTT